MRNSIFEIESTPALVIITAIMTKAKINKTICIFWDEIHK